MEWTDIQITVPHQYAETAEAIATMVSNGGIYIEDYRDLEQQAWEIAHVDLIEQDLLDQPRDIVKVHMYLAPDENPAEILPLFKERLEASGVEYKLETSGIEQEDWQNAWKKYYHAMDIGQRLAIVPGWETYDTDRIVITMDPGNPQPVPGNAGQHGKGRRACAGYRHRLRHSGHCCVEAGRCRSRGRGY